MRSIIGAREVNNVFRIADLGCATGMNTLLAAEHWVGKDEVMVFPLVKLYTFSLACNLFAGINHPDDQAWISDHLMALQKGLLQIPVDLPGTRYNRAKRGANAIREQLDGLIRERKIALEEGNASPDQDLLSFLLSSVDEQGQFLTHDEIKDNILLLIFAGHDTSSSTLTVLLKFLAKNPHCYNEVLRGTYVHIMPFSLNILIF